MIGHKKLRGVVTGAGYFSQFQYEAWHRIPEVQITALCDLAVPKAHEIQKQYNIPHFYDDYKRMLDEQQPDFVDIITPPETHLEMCQLAAERNIAIICQKPMAPTLEESQQIVDIVNKHNVPFMVHENFRWQPWYRAVKQILDNDTLGQVYHLHFRMRTGDGWGEDAYLARQPFFRKYPRLLVYETGVHFVDAFRFLLGEITSLYANLRQLNSVIKGEDAGQVFFTFDSGATAIWDANRYNEADTDNARYTFGEMRIDAEKGHLLLDTSGNICIKPLGQPSYQYTYQHQDINFAGDCVYAIQRHFVDEFLNGKQFESTGEDYLRNVHAIELIYQSAAAKQVIAISTKSNS